MIDEVWIVVKGIYIVFFVFYVVFSFVVARQVKSMTSTLEVGFEKFLNNLAIVHVLVAIILTVAAFVFL